MLEFIISQAISSNMIDIFKDPGAGFSVIFVIFITVKLGEKSNKPRSLNYVIWTKGNA